MCRTAYQPGDPTGEKPAKRILHDLGYLGFYLHAHHGGRSGKQHILIRLLNAGGTMGQRELQEASPITSASLSETLAKLESEGLVTRLRSEEDRRRQTIALTDAGRARARELASERDAFEQSATACLSEEQTASLAEMLDLLAGHWHQMEEERGKSMNQKGDAPCSNR